MTGEMIRLATKKGTTHEKKRGQGAPKFAKGIRTESRWGKRAGKAKEK